MARIKKKPINEYLSFFLGLIVCNNILYVYQGDSSNINISAFYSFFLFVFINIQKKYSIPVGAMGEYIEPGMKIYSFLVFILLLPSTIIFTSTKFAESPFKGVISYILIISTVFDIIMLRDKKESIFYGLLAGFILNILFSFFQYFCYLRGVDFSLSRWFPDRAFQENIGMYRAQGFFLETSYFAAFISVTVPIIFAKVKSSLINAAILGSSLLLLGLSFTGNIVNYLFGLGLYIIFIGKDKMKGKAHGILAVFVFLSIIGLVFSNQILRTLKTLGFLDNFSKGLADAIITNTKNNTSNATRLGYQIKALNLIPDYLFGVGYNMASPLLQLKLGIVATFNVLITNQLELGVLGTISYFIMFYNTGLKMIFKGRNAYQKSLGIAMIIMFIAQAGNGIRWFGFCILIYGLAAIEYHDIFKQNSSIQNECMIDSIQ